MNILNYYKGKTKKEKEIYLKRGGAGTFDYLTSFKDFLNNKRSSFLLELELLTFLLEELISAYEP